MRLLLRVLFAVLIFCLPVFSILAAENLICRAPDLYTYEFTKTQITREARIGVSERDLGEFFSDYFLGKKEEFSYITEYQDREQDLFNLRESNVMRNIRELLNHLTLFMFGVVLITIAAYWILLHYNRKEGIRLAFKWSLVFYGILWVTFGLILFPWAPFKSLETEDLLLRLITSGFITDWFLAGIFISAVVMGILGSITWKLTKPRRMFW
ncbi:MAG: DUF1461 domain-containing protein [Eubacteriales bacterium]|nr:DUF1461 domain-containing protein [Eubacteriales bacterium]